MPMNEVIYNKLSYDRLMAAMELLTRKAKSDKYLNLTDINEVLIVAGLDEVKEETCKEVEVIE